MIEALRLSVACRGKVLEETGEARGDIPFDMRVAEGLANDQDRTRSSAKT